MAEAETAAASAAEAAEAEIVGRVAHMSDAELVSVLLSHHRDAQTRRRQAEFCRERLLDVLLESCAGAARDVSPADHSTWADVSSAYPSFHPHTVGHSGTVTSARCVSAIEVEEVTWRGGGGGGGGDYDHNNAYQHALHPPPSSPSALQQQQAQQQAQPRHSHLGSGGMPPKHRKKKDKGGGPSWGPRPHSPPRKRAGSAARAAAQLQAHCDSCAQVTAMERVRVRHLHRAQVETSLSQRKDSIRSIERGSGGGRAKVPDVLKRMHVNGKGRSLL